MIPHAASSPRLLTPARPDLSHWLDLPTDRASVKIARDTVRERLCAWDQAGDLCMDAVLLVSELATNAVLHTRGGRMLCGVSLAADTHLRIEVHDEDGGGLNLPGRLPGHDDENGRGLLLVRQIADAWGVDRSTRTKGNAVWAELSTTG